MTESRRYCKVLRAPKILGATQAISGLFEGHTFPCAPILLTCEGSEYFGIFQEQAIEIVVAKLDAKWYFRKWCVQQDYPQEHIPYFFIPREYAEFVDAPVGS